MRVKKKKSGFISFLSSLLLFLLCVFMVGFVAKFTNGFTSDFSTFYVTFNGEDILSDTSMRLLPGVKNEVDVKYTLSSNKGYEIKVVPCVDEESDFYYLVDSQAYKFSELKDLTSAFSIEKGEKSFTIAAPMSLQDMLEKLYPGKVVTEVPDAFETGCNYVSIVVSSTGAESVSVDCSWVSFDVDIEDKEGIVF